MSKALMLILPILYSKMDPLIMSISLQRMFYSASSTKQMNLFGQWSCTFILIWTLGNIQQWNLNHNTTIFHPTNEVEKVFSVQWRPFCVVLTHWGRVTQMCVSKLTIIDPDDGLAPTRRQAIIWTDAGILFIDPLGTHFSKISKFIYFHSIKRIWTCRLRNVSHFLSASACLFLYH